MKQNPPPLGVGSTSTIHLPEEYPRVGISDGNERDDVPHHGIDERAVHGTLRVLDGKRGAYPEAGDADVPDSPVRICNHDVLALVQQRMV